MTKVKLFDYDFEWKCNNYWPYEFLEDNINYYADKWLENNPTQAHRINDWDLDQVYEDIDMADVVEDMIECYIENLKLNYNV